MPNYVKAREHHGTNSLDITIPADIVKKMNIKKGDLFIVEEGLKNNNLILVYKRIYNA